MPETNPPTTKILFTGGGTAGHIFPIIAIVREMKKISPAGDWQFFYVGPKDDFAENLLSQEGIEVKIIYAGKIRRYLDLQAFFQNLVDIFFKMPAGFFQAFYYNLILAPDLIFSKGGYGSLPVVLSGWLFLTPIFLHESDIVPGLANRLVSKFCLDIFVSFPAEKTSNFPAKKMIAVGNPIRTELLEGNKEKAREDFKLSGGKPVILVLGGSQGSQRINDVLMLVLPELAASFELIHQTGQNNFKEIEAESKIVLTPDLQKLYHPFPFLNEEMLKQAFSLADLVVSRAGSGSIFEIASAGRPSILIPLAESAQKHQLKNAYEYAQKGAALIIEEANLTPHFFLERLKFLFSQPEKLKEMGEKSLAFARPQASRVIAEYIVAYLSL